MEKILLILTITSVLNSVCYSQTNEETMKSSIKEVVLTFEKASAERNIDGLKKVLHPDYRAVANRFKGSDDVVLISRENYLSMTETGKIGGTSYDTDFISISVANHTAMAEVLLRSKTSSDMHKYLFLIQNQEDKWQVISDLPLVIE